MNPNETALLLRAIAAIDNRIPSQEQIIAWGSALHDLQLSECQAAVAYLRRGQPELYLQPGHIRQTVLAHRHDAAERARPKRLAAELPQNSREDQHCGYLTASAALQAAVDSKYERLGQERPAFPLDPFVRRGRKILGETACPYSRTW